MGNTILLFGTFDTSWPGFEKTCLVAFIIWYLFRMSFIFGLNEWNYGAPMNAARVGCFVTLVITPLLVYPFFLMILVQSKNAPFFYIQFGLFGSNVWCMELDTIDIRLC